MLTYMQLTHKKKFNEAWEKEYFKNSIIKPYDQNGDLMLNHDELIRKETTMQSLASLVSSFQK